MMPHIPVGAGSITLSQSGYDSDSAFSTSDAYLHFFADEQGDSILHFPGCSSTPSTLTISEGITHPLVFSPVGANKLATFLQEHFGQTPVSCWQCAFVGYHSPLHSHSTNEWQIRSKPAQEHQQNQLTDMNLQETAAAEKGPGKKFHTLKSLPCEITKIKKGAMNSISQDTNTVKIFRKLGRQKKKLYLTQIDGTGNFYFYNITQLEKPWDLWVKSWPWVPSLSPGWFSQHQQQPETLMIQLLSCIFWIALVFKPIYSTINTRLKDRIVSLAPTAWWLPKGKCSVRTALLGKGKVGVMQEETLPASAPRAWGAPGEAPPALHRSWGWCSAINNHLFSWT